MAQAQPRNRLYVRYVLDDGRCSTLVSWADGEWKVEIFPSLDHVALFAAGNDMEVIRRDQEQEQ